MNAAHFHLVVNHMPTAISLLALFAMAVGFIGKNASIKKFSLGLMFLVGIATGTSYYTGNAANEASFGEGSPYHERVERHEDSAGVTWVLGIVTGVVGLVGLLLGRRMNDVPLPVMAAALLVLLASFFFIAKTANLGSHIMHPETRSDAMSRFLNPGEG